MNEREALLATALRAVETVDGDRRLWTDDDRSWSSQAAAEAVGEGASAAVFVGRRAALALERLRGRDAALVGVVDGLLWRPWIGGLVMLLALFAGVAIDRIGSAQEINLLAPPVLGLLAWNVGVYLVILVALLSRRRRAGRAAGPLRRFLGACVGASGRLPRHRQGPMPAAILARLIGDWSAVAAPLHGARLARILHFSAALFAVGLVAGLYLRGFAVEYRATWESTFLGADAAHALLTAMLAPGVWLTGGALPDVAALAAIRSGAWPATENAAPWLHLLAATIVVVVVVPRIVLGVFSAFVERRRSRQLLTRFDEPYYQRLLHGYHAGPVQLTVIPYSYHPLPIALAGLQTLLGRVFGSKAAIRCTAPVNYGDEDALPAAARPDGNGPLIALFSLAATPERETQGAFVAALRAAASAAPLLVLVDEAPWHARFDADAKRLAARRSAWRAELAAVTEGAELANRGLVPVFVNLAKLDLASAQDEIERRLEGSL
ncbi:DUF2868 domain-containing protein [Candidatus Accumulibacter sp. ACC003]|uniref:DUF2868 domain-containing protein n=1 Tax=Candidatus Accumulibacter sp. ACC003 TaxID=2823334 RepID=UPI0025B8152C|nr:DUF2868 domain-containing protein [Candidatus Accumulibacter sp. ACC003]